MKVFCILFLCLIALTHQAQQSCTSYPITRVFKQNKSNYSLNSSNTWRDYPDLKLSLQLGQSRLVNIAYVITIPSTGASHLVTRLLVDNKEVEYYRAITGNTVYHTNHVNGYVALSQGSHEIVVQYRTPGVFTVGSADWITAQIQATY